MGVESVNAPTVMRYAPVALPQKLHVVSKVMIMYPWIALRYGLVRTSPEAKTGSGLGLGIEKMSNSIQRPKGGQNEVENRWKVNLKGKENKNRPNDARKWKIRAIFSN